MRTTLIRATFGATAVAALALGAVAVGGPAQAAGHRTTTIAKPVPAGAKVVTVTADVTVGAPTAAGAPVEVPGATDAVKPVGENMEIDPATGCLTREYAARFAMTAEQAQEGAITVPGEPTGDLVDCWTMAEQLKTSGR